MAQHIPKPVTPPQVGSAVSRTHSSIDRTRRSLEQTLPPANDRHAQLLQRAIRNMAERQYEKALEFLNSAGQSPEVLNAKGVCLMRLGFCTSAVATYRSFVLDTGSAMVRTGLPECYVVNLATALLISGRPAGCLDVLGSIRKEKNSDALKLLDAVARWESRLSWWQRFNWIVGRIEPDTCSIEIDFEPGVFELPAGHGQPAAKA